MAREGSVCSPDSDLIPWLWRHEVDTAWDALQEIPPSQPTIAVQEDPYFIVPSQPTPVTQEDPFGAADPMEEVVVQSEGFLEGVSAFSMSVGGETLRVALRMSEDMAAPSMRDPLASPPSPPTPEDAADALQEAMLDVSSRPGPRDSAAGSSGDPVPAWTMPDDHWLELDAAREAEMVRWLCEREGYEAPPPPLAGRCGTWVPYEEYQDSDGDDCEPRRRYQWCDDEPDVDKEVEAFEAQMAVMMPDEEPGVLEYAVRCGDLTREEAEAAQMEVEVQLAAEYYEAMMCTAEEDEAQGEADGVAWRTTRSELPVGMAVDAQSLVAGVPSPDVSDALLQKPAGDDAGAALVDLTEEVGCGDEEDHRPLVELAPEAPPGAKRSKVAEALRGAPAPDVSQRARRRLDEEVDTGPGPMALPLRSVLLNDVPVQLVNRPTFGDVHVGWARRVMKAESANEQADVRPPQVFGSTCAMQMWASMVCAAREATLAIRAVVLELLGTDGPHVRVLYQIFMQRSLVAVAVVRDSRCVA